MRTKFCAFVFLLVSSTAISSPRCKDTLLWLSGFKTQIRNEIVRPVRPRYLRTDFPFGTSEVVVDAHVLLKELGRTKAKQLEKQAEKKTKGKGLNIAQLEFPDGFLVREGAQSRIILIDPKGGAGQLNEFMNQGPYGDQNLWASNAHFLAKQFKQLRFDGTDDPFMIRQLQLLTRKPGVIEKIRDFYRQEAELNPAVIPESLARGVDILRLNENLAPKDRLMPFRLTAGADETAYINHNRLYIRNDITGETTSVGITHNPTALARWDLWQSILDAKDRMVVAGKKSF